MTWTGRFGKRKLHQHSKEVDIPSQQQRQDLTDIWKILDELTGAIREVSELRDQTADTVVRLRVAPGEISDATLIALRQKIEKLRGSFETCEGEADSASCIAAGMRIK